jgi:hypothetical protein
MDFFRSAHVSLLTAAQFAQVAAVLSAFGEQIANK